MITDNMIEQAKIETLFQMSRTEFIESISENQNIHHDDVFNFKYPYGIVTISIRKIQDDTMYTNFQVDTSKGVQYIYQHAIPYHES